MSYRTLMAAMALLRIPVEAFGAEAQPVHHGRIVSISGCPRDAGVEIGCLILNGYDISSARPLPRRNYLGIALSGVISPDVSFCPGTALKGIKWSYTRTRCRR
jgi:hypothetical protein